MLPFSPEHYSLPARPLLELSFTTQQLPAHISLDARLTLIRYLHGLGVLRIV